jgi:fucose permease
VRFRQARPPVLVSYAAFVLIGINVGISGVLLPSQMASYGVGRATIGITFFTSSAGFVLASVSTGALIHKAGIRIALTAGGVAFTLAGLYLATRPPFAAFVLAQLLLGYGTGVLEAALNVYIAGLPNATTLLNRLHAFFGVGALVGPPLAAWILGFASWTVVWLVVSVACVPLVAGFLLAYPGPERSTADAHGTPVVHAVPDGPGTAPAAAPSPPPRGLLHSALRDRGVQLGAAMLFVYVGVELGVGNWGFSYLVQTRALPASLAGYTISGFWLGLTLGRFLISPIAARAGATTTAMIYACLAGISAAIVVAWVSPAVVACVAFGLLGFFLGPVFPTTMAIVPRLTRPRLVPTAIGVMNAGAVIGGSALPWLVGTLAQNAGMWVLLPFILTLSVAQFAVWRPIAARLERQV